jgi:limonene-1,2-epoxide hydrolase
VGAAGVEIASAQPANLRYHAAMHKHAQLLETFYQAFQRRDGAAMAACYHPEAQFSDPVFPDLRGPEVGAMWRMLTSRSKGLDLQFSAIQADDTQGSAHWEAIYPFSATGRTVHNIIDAKFQFKDGLIYRHQDHFDFYRWARMALGLKGILLGWLPPVQNAIRAQARQALDPFLKESAA